MHHTCKICSPFVPGLTGQAGRSSSDEAASHERVGNLRITPMRGGPGRTRAAVERMKLWENGRLLKGMAEASRAILDEVDRVRSRQSLHGLYDKTGQLRPTEGSTRISRKTL